MRLIQLAMLHVEVEELVGSIRLIMPKNAQEVIISFVGGEPVTARILKLNHRPDYHTSYSPLALDPAMTQYLQKLVQVMPRIPTDEIKREEANLFLGAYGLAYLPNGELVISQKPPR